MKKKVTIDIDIDIPKGFEVVAYRQAQRGEYYLRDGLLEHYESLRSLSVGYYLILKKIHKSPVLVYCLQIIDTETGKGGHFRKADNVHTQTNFRKLNTRLMYEDVEYDVILTNEGDDGDLVWLGYWNDGPDK